MSQISKDLSLPNLYSQKNKLIRMEKQAKRLAKNIQIQRNILKNKKKFEEMQLQLQKYQIQIKQRKKQIITKRMSQMEQMKKQREILIKATNNSVVNVLKREKQKKNQLQQLAKKQRQEYQVCYQKALEQRRKYLQPIDFEQLKKHQKRYIQKKVKTQQCGSALQPVIEPYYVNIKSPRKKTKIAKSVVQEYQQNKQYQKNKKKQIKQLLKRRIKYGNSVEKEYLKNRVKTQNTVQSDKEKKKLQNLIERQKYLRSLKKPKLHPVVDEQKAQKFEILKLKKSSELSPQQKIYKLQIMREDYDKKFKRGNTQALDKLSRVNLAKADLYLNLI